MNSAARLLALSIALIAAAPARGAPCDDTIPFRKEVLLENPRDDLQEPLRMDFDRGADGSVDIYLAERGGRVRKYDGSTGKVSELGRLLVYSREESGLTGLALDPDFKRNRRLFLGANFPAGSRYEFRILRYTLDAAGLLDPNTLTPILAIPTANGMHAPLVLRFDRDGNLLAAVGDNAAGESGPANTNDFRGKVLRIRPKEEGGYTIPPGNLFPPGTDKTRPEVYVMGVRNSYSMTYEGKTGRIAWGDFGPDGKGARTEEHNITAVPGNFGWPHFAGRNFALDAVNPRDPAAPANTGAGNTGLAILPPALPAVHCYGQNGSVTGPLYRRQDGAARSLPPLFEGLWFITDFNQGWVDTLRLDAGGTAIKAQGRLKNLLFKRPIDFVQGPDGALYAIEYAGFYSTSPDSKVVRLVYQGCAPPVAVRKAPGESPWFDRGALERSGGAYQVLGRDLTGRLLKAIGDRRHRRP